MTYRLCVAHVDQAPPQLRRASGRVAARRAGRAARADRDRGGRQATRYAAGDEQPAGGRAGLSAEMAIRFEKAFGVRADTLMRMQTWYELKRITRTR